MSLKLGTTDISGVPTTLINTVNNKLDASTYTSNPRTNAVYITQTYSNGTSWYRIWSDGWCEQGGLVASGSGNKTILFVKSYANTNYTVSFALLRDTNGGGYCPTFTKQTDRLNLIQDSSTTLTNSAKSWYTCGYIS